MSMKIRNIEIDQLIGESSKFLVYLGTLLGDQKVILKVAKTFKDNRVLVDDATEFNLLRNLEEKIRKLELPYKQCSNYNLLFARLFSSFIERSQDDRRINVFTIPEIDLDDLAPLPKLSSQVEIDARTSVWIIGRLFKFYSMFEILRADENSDACKYPIFSESDYLISPEKHRLVYYNFSGEMYDVYASNVVKTLASYILKWTSFNEDEIEYQKILLDFASNGRKTAAEAHQDLYDVVERTWGINYHPFTYRQHGTKNWNVKEK